jgi:peroxiredoxin
MSDTRIPPERPQTRENFSGERRESYNYEHFDVAVADVDRGVTAGDDAIDVPLYTLDGEIVQLADLWASGPIVVEFGSITCPIFTKKVEAMDALAEKYADGVDFYVVYTREAHPGQNYPAHRCLEEKLSNAADASQYESIARTVLVDGVDGTMHTQYVALPNAVYLIGTDGVVAHQADWLDPEALDDAVEALLESGGRGGDVTPEALRNNFEKPTRDSVVELYRVLSRAGPGSLRDFLRTMPRMLLYRFRTRLRKNR